MDFMASVMPGNRPRRQSPDPELDVLTAREVEVLTLIARGYTTSTISTKLVISPYTVNTHIRHIYEKMQIHKRSELLNYINLQRSDF